jgi:hypothetical protein
METITEDSLKQSLQYKILNFGDKNMNKLLQILSNIPN